MQKRQKKLLLLRNSKSKKSDRVKKIKPLLNSWTTEDKKEGRTSKENKTKQKKGNTVYQTSKMFPLQII